MQGTSHSCLKEAKLRFYQEEEEEERELISNLIEATGTPPPQTQPRSVGAFRRFSLSG